MSCSTDAELEWQGMPIKIPDTPDPHLNKNDPDHCQLGIAVLGVLQACTCTEHEFALTLESSGSPRSRHI